MTHPALGDVSRETFERLEIYAALVEKWTPRINLIARSTLPDIWTRHFADSAQVLNHVRHPIDHWVDLGSGGGFPGLVVAILGMDLRSPNMVTLVESDARKCSFLRTVIRETDAPARVITGRIETMPSLQADILSARALANLSALLSFAERHLSPGGTALFSKGAQWQEEVIRAQSKWNFDYQIATSEIESGSVILSITGVSRA